jgi:hypothetical protein
MSVNTGAAWTFWPADAVDLRFQSSTRRVAIPDIGVMGGLVRLRAARFIARQ